MGTLEPRKNLARLITAYEQVRGSLPEPWPLVLVGPSGWGERIEPQPGVVMTGLVRPTELSALYATARLLAYVPLLEGFGLPPVEAMAFGAPVVASPLPSTAGAAYEVDPRSVDSIAGGLLRVAVDEVERERLRTAGSKRSGELAWSSIARRHLEVWDEARRRVPGGPPWLTAGSASPSTARRCPSIRSERDGTRCSWPRPSPHGTTSTSS